MCDCTDEPLIGACCDPYDGTCADDVLAGDCTPPLQFHYQQACADLDPQCGNPGACCIDNPPPNEDPPGECTVEFELNCAGRFVAGATCDPDPFTPACGEYDACWHEIVMMDDYGDGWNGGFIDVSVDGITILTGVTLATGAGPESVLFEAGTGSVIQTVWTAGGWPYEASYCIYDPYGTELCCDGLGGVDPVGVTCTGNCDLPAGACCLGLDGCEMTTSEECAIEGGTFLGDFIECNPADCDGDGMTDQCALEAYGVADCNNNGIPDSCDIADCDGSPWCSDCQGDGILDACQLAAKARACDAIVYDAGECDGVNGTRPTAGWDTTGYRGQVRGSAG